VFQILLTDLFSIALYIGSQYMYEAILIMLLGQLRFTA